MALHVHTDDHDHINSDPGPMYQMEWVQKLIRQIQHCLQTNSAWLGIDQSKRQRVLDYACGNGTVSSALLAVFPEAVFQGMDIATSQVQRFNNEATKLLGESHGRMFAIQGDLNYPQPVLSEPEWSEFDAAIISMALHHVKDPVGFLARLRQRVKQDGALVVVDWLQQSSTTDGSHAAERRGGDHKYDAADMAKLSQGPKIWPGFSIHDIHADMTAAGCTDVDVREYPEPIDAPEQMLGYDRIFIAKATVL
ncbi:S-adenosyl-L-methionine-dependent methyltransferase [Zopfia rhizophila CBS 207.26]|uniref:S-adenosyl-L-methionine-dependent methyltransferase n=1 Tax=Zopfia rhizophila CBS 207.26 TaxID=1314779 RepID=A0A6A6DYJ0_9PEZI|nr:S-adenosyl-L-methionine-dependent methyltransferase [Zopfia rhizophila CBS 207.26]